MEKNNIISGQRDKDRLPGIGLYFHIPFCKKKCSYCDFLSAPASEVEREAYGKLLLEEVRASKSLLSYYRPDSIYIGGGTPSLFTPSWYEKLSNALDNIWGDSWREKEVTMEANPGTLTLENLKGYKAAGINRLSIGLQSTVDAELKILGRIHTYKEFLENFENARKAGFSNINVDLMSGIPGQTPDSCKKSLNRAVELEPEHISSYSLILEKGTEFYNIYGKKEKGSLCGTMAEERSKEGSAALMFPPLPKEEEDRLMYQETKEILEGAGYYRYEISNYAKPGFEAVHNMRYWERKEYAGFGLGAASFIRDIKPKEYRFCNSRDMGDYQRMVLDEGSRNRECRSLVLDEFINRRCDVERIDEKAAMEEFMFLGLRKTRGVSRREFYNEFGKDIDSIYGDVLKKYEMSGLMAQTGTDIYLTDRGIDVSNRVMADFLLS